MFVINEDNSIYVTRGDILLFSVKASNNGTPYTFKVGDVVRMCVVEKKAYENVVLQKDFPITTESTTVEIYLEEADTKIGETISKAKDYWYEIVLNPETEPQTIVGYDDDGAKIFKLFPEGKDSGEDITEEDIPIIDSELSIFSSRPVANQAIAKAIANINNKVATLDSRVTSATEFTSSASGSAITIESASAPLQNLKLFGKTTQNGTPTPEAPVPLVSVGGSGSFTVKIQGENVEEQTLTMPYPLRSYNGVQDEIDFAKGVLIQRCYLATDFSFNFELENVNVYRASKPYPMDYENAMCSHTDVNENTNNDNTHFYIGSSAIWAYLPKDVEATNIQVLSRLETPQETPLTETELNAYRQLMTNSGTTNIVSEADIELEYYTPYGQALGNIHTQVNNDYLKMQGGSTL